MSVRLTFNTLLAEAGVSPGEVRLMRHQHVASTALHPILSGAATLPSSSDTRAPSALTAAPTLRESIGPGLSFPQMAALLGDAALVERPQNEIEPTSFEAEADGWSAVWTDWKPKPENPALRVADKSVVTRRVNGVDFREEYHSEFVWDNED